MTDTPFDTAETDRLLSTTRAVRKRLDLTRPVPREVILECLQVATQAPTGGNAQMWRWIVVDDPEVRAGLAALYKQRADGYFAMHRANLGDAPHKILDSSEYLNEHLHEVPVLVVPCLLARLSERPSTEEAAGAYGTILPAVWSFMLALRSRGLGSAYTTLHLANEREAAELLGIPDSVTQVALIPVAYTIGTDFKPGTRKPIEDVTYFNGWRKK
jgi:nitroreductase